MSTHGRRPLGANKQSSRDFFWGIRLAQHAFRAGLVDDVHVFVFPLVVGGGKPGLPPDVRVDLELLDERPFGNGVVYLHHRTR